MVFFFSGAARRSRSVDLTSAPQSRGFCWDGYPQRGSCGRGKAAESWLWGLAQDADVSSGPPGRFAGNVGLALGTPRARLAQGAGERLRTNMTRARRSAPARAGDPAAWGGNHPLKPAGPLHRLRGADRGGHHHNRANLAGRIACAKERPHRSCLTFAHQPSERDPFGIAHRQISRPRRHHAGPTAQLGVVDERGGRVRMADCSSPPDRLDHLFSTKIGRF